MNVAVSAKNSSWIWASKFVRISRHFDHSPIRALTMTFAKARLLSATLTRWNNYRMCQTEWTQPSSQLFQCTWPPISLTKCPLLHFPCTWKRAEAPRSDPSKTLTETSWASPLYIWSPSYHWRCCFASVTHWFKPRIMLPSHSAVRCVQSWTIFAS